MIIMNIILLITLYIEIIARESLRIKQKLITLLESNNQDEFTPKRFNNSNALVLYNLYDQFQNYFKYFNNDVDANNCWNSIFNNMVADYDYTTLFFYSGQKLTEIGDENLCLEKKNTYLLVLLTYNVNETSIKIQDKMSLFTSKDKYNLGICIWKECNNFIKEELINNINQDLKNNLNQIYNITDIKVIWNNEELKKEKNALSLGIKIFFIFLIIYFIIFIILKLIMLLIIRHKNTISKEALELKLEKRKRKDYLKIEETKIIKEEENEDDFNEEEEEENDDKKKNNSKSKSKSLEKSDENHKKNNKSKEEENEEDEDDNDEEGEEEEDNEDNDDSKISNGSLFKKEIEQSKIKYIERNLNLINNNNIDPSDLEYSLDDKYEKKEDLLINNKKNKPSNFILSMNKFNDSYLKLIKIQTLTEYKNQIFSNKGLEMITGLRTVFLILITLNITFQLFQESPAIRQINYNFIQDFLFGLVKFSSFGVYFWVYLDGFVYTFKLMHFIKKNREFKTFFKFLLNLIPKMYVFLIIFYGVYFFQKDIGKFGFSSSLFEQYTENNFNYKCLKNPIYLIFPFINPINSSNNKMVYNYFNNCYQFSYLIINEFYCIIILIIMFYFLYKYQSKILDIIISIILLINIIVMNLLPYFLEGIKDEKYYLLKYVLGETFSLRFPHTMFNIFFIGIFTGLIYYYHYFSVNDLNSYVLEDYLPFNYLSNLMQFFYKCHWSFKLLFILLSLGIIIIDCLVFFIVQSNGVNGQILYQFSGFLKFIYLYETPIIILAVSILLILLLFTEDKFQIKAFLGSKMFYIMEKISFSYVCLIQMISLLFISSSNYHGETWSFLFFFYIACYEFALGLFSSFIFTLVFELPAKILVNNLRGKNNMKVKNLN